MGTDMQSDPTATSLKLPAALDLAAAADLLAAMQARLQAPSPLSVDASQVETLTLACMQVLLAARRSFDRMSIERPSPEFVSAVECVGLNCNELCNPGAAEPETQIADADPIAAEPETQITDTDPVAVADNLSPPQAEASPMTKRILTIDDSKTIRDMLMLTLADAGFEVLQAVDGQDGLDVLGKEQVDVVITDINMPRMDGYEVIRQMRSNDAHKTTPILVLTTESESDKRDIARFAGATGWMVKPFDPDRLIATINKVAP